MTRFSAPPPSYESHFQTAAAAHSKWNPLHWPLWAKITGGVVSTAVVVAIVVGAVVGSESSSSYPDYSALTYTIAERYEGEDFFDNFYYYQGYDPSGGFVHYVPEATANSTQYNLTYASSTSAVLKVDTTDTDASTGRYSVRITSKNTYNSGLFVFDVLHSPYGCSTWPALWLSDPSNWPAHGEIDVMEAVEQGTWGNQMTLHTSEGCTMKGKRKEIGRELETNCYEGADDNAGCGVMGTNSTYGPVFNENGGGIYAMELRDAGIRVWFFNRTSIPGDLTSSNDSSPDPSTWGTALADFPSTHCDISSHFKNQSIIADIDLCGDWAGVTSVYSDEYGCPGTCETFVTSNNTAFETAYWEWSSWRVYSAS